MSASVTDVTSRCALSWSAGTDSWLALTRAREQGLAVTTFVTMCDEDGTSKSHALPPELIEAQGRALGATALSVRVPKGRYAACFDACLRELAASGHTHMIFGDIDLQAHRDWLAPACERAGLVPVFPLWGESRAALARELDHGAACRRGWCAWTRAGWTPPSAAHDYDADFLAPPARRRLSRAARTGSSTPSSPVARGSHNAAARGRRRANATSPPQPPFSPTGFVFQALSLARTS